MLPFDVEAHYTTNRHPKGGNAPLRHKLALYNYIERQKEQRENIPTIESFPVGSTALDKFISAGSSLLNRISTHLLREGKTSH